MLRFLQKISDLQPHGEAGTRRHFDNLVWTLPIPEYDDADPVHRDLATVAVRAEKIAEGVDLTALVQTVGPPIFGASNK